jgi:hypothetical protein
MQMRSEAGPRNKVTMMPAATTGIARTNPRVNPLINLGLTTVFIRHSVKGNSLLVNRYWYWQKAEPIFLASARNKTDVIQFKPLSSNE